MRANRDRDSEMVSFRERVWRGVEREGKKEMKSCLQGFIPGTIFSLLPQQRKWYMLEERK